MVVKVEQFSSFESKQTNSHFIDTSQTCVNYTGINAMGSHDSHIGQCTKVLPTFCVMAGTNGVDFFSFKGKCNHTKG